MRKMLYPSQNMKNSCISIFFILSGIAFSCFLGCEKKDRLTANTFQFAINPPAAAVVKGQAQTLKAQGVSPGGVAAADAEWSVSSTAGALNTQFGPQVILQANTLGDVMVTATWNGMTATSQIAIVTYIPSASTFDVYTDELPTESGLDPDIFVLGLTLTTFSSGYVAQGNEAQRASNTVNGDNWGVTLDKTAGAPVTTKDLSSFSGGNLKFAVRLVNRTLGGGESLDVRIESAVGGPPGYVPLGAGHGFSGASLEWQEITVPITAFPGVDLSQVEIPFRIQVTTGSSLTFDIDAIRWQL